MLCDAEWSRSYVLRDNMHKFLEKVSTGLLNYAIGMGESVAKRTDRDQEEDR